MNTTDPGIEFRNSLRRANITQVEMAKVLGVSQSAIASWGAEGRGVPPKRAPQIAKILNVDASRISVIPAGMQPWNPQQSSTKLTIVPSSPTLDEPIDLALFDLIRSKHLSTEDKALISALIVRLIG